MLLEVADVLVDVDVLLEVVVDVLVDVDVLAMDVGGNGGAVVWIGSIWWW